MSSSTITSSPCPAAFLTLPQAAAYLGLSANTLYVWRHRRQGPPSFLMGRRVMYRITAIDAWVADQEKADSRSNPSLNPLNRRPEQAPAIATVGLRY